MEWRIRSGAVSLDRVAIMGILNVTPDSFSDGGLWLDADRATAHAIEMARHGATVIDVGGESTRPDADPVDEDEEMRRVLPVIERVTREIDVPVSIDTRKASVAEAAVTAGASIVNDTLGEASNGALWKVAAGTGAGLVFMHSRGTPATMRGLNDYADLVKDVRLFLERSAAAIETAGVPRESIVLDPGFGFAKDPNQNLELLRRLDEIVDTGYPILSGTSRKSFIGAVLDLPEGERVEGTAATVAWAVAKGARIVRVHDVPEMTRVVRMTESIVRGVW